MTVAVCVTGAPRTTDAEILCVHSLVDNILCTQQRVSIATVQEMSNASLPTHCDARFTR